MDNLKELRLKQGLTQEKLAEKSGVSRITIAKLESGTQTVIKSSTIIKLADALQVAPQVLLCPQT